MIKCNYSRKEDIFTMKFKKLMMLSLAALLLNGCALGQDVERTVAETRLAEAFQATDEVELDTYAVDTKGELSDLMKSYEDGSVTTEKYSQKVKSSIKAKGLKGETPELAANYEEVYEKTVDGVEEKYRKYTEEFYYKNKWLYGEWSDIERIDGATSTESEKGKVQIGLVDFTNVSVLEFIGNLSDSEYIAVGFDYETLSVITKATDDVKAKELLGALTVTYNFDAKALMRLMYIAFGGDLDAMTEEERAEFEQMIDEAVAEQGDSIVIHKYAITIGVNKEGYVNLLSVVQDVSYKEYDEEVTPRVLLASEDMKLSRESRFRINEKVTIKFPNLGDYQEIEPK